MFDLFTGNCLEVLKNFEDNSIDAIVTDPPYGLSFMGKKWDYDVPSVEIWAECLRVLKPGGHVLSFSGTRTYHRMVVNMEDAGFEIRDQLAWVYGCLDDKTECLTQRGWLHYKDIKSDDKVLQWNCETDTLSWVVPTKLHEYDFDGELVQIENRHTRQALTPNHRVYAKIRRHSRHPKPVAYEVVEADVIDKRSMAWNVDLPLASFLREGENIDIHYAYIVGWWLTDAWVHGDGKACMFSQSKPKTLVKLRNALEQYNPSEYIKKAKQGNHNDEHTFYFTGPLADNLIAEFPDRKLTWNVLSWSFDARMKLFEGLMDGDGSIVKDQHSHTFWSTDQERRDVFMALCLSLGKRVYEDVENHSVYVNCKKRTTQIQNRHRPKKLPYKGKVWCVTVPTGAFVVRREGRPFITGNSGFPKSLDVSKAIDKMLGAERKSVGYKVTGNAKQRTSATGEFADGKHGGQQIVSVTEPATEAAKQWQGYGTSLKPAWEPICLARKPLAGTVAQNVLEHGTGALNIDGCRVPVNNETLGGGMVSKGRPKAPEGWDRPWMHDKEVTERKKIESAMKVAKAEQMGRWPANLMHDGSEEVVSLFPNSKGAVSNGKKKGNGFSGDWGEMEQEPSYGDDGSTARFFYCPKASKKDRDEGLTSEEKEYVYFQTGNGASGNPSSISEGRNTSYKNTHATVKPTELMKYLCRLITPPNGVVLDPFMGSGSTGKGAVLEGFSFIGIDMNEEYVNIARQRIEFAHKKANEKNVLDFME